MHILIVCVVMWKMGGVTVCDFGSLCRGSVWVETVVYRLCAGREGGVSGFGMLCSGLGR